MSRRLPSGSSIENGVRTEPMRLRKLSIVPALSLKDMLFLWSKLFGHAILSIPSIQSKSIDRNGGQAVPDGGCKHGPPGNFNRPRPAGAQNQVTISPFGMNLS